MIIQLYNAGMFQKSRSLLQKIYSDTRFARTISPKLFPIAISRTQGEFLRSFVETHKPETIIECGFGFGISALWFLSSRHQPNKHFIVDPFRERSKGAEMICAYIRAHKHVRLDDTQTSQQFLAEFEKSGKKVDFIFNDADERFDGLLCDMYFSTRILSVGGHVIIRNVWNPSIRKVILFCIKNLPYDTPQFTQYERFFIEHIPYFGERQLRKKIGELDFIILRLREVDTREWDHFVSF